MSPSVYAPLRPVTASGRFRAEQELLGNAVAAAVSALWTAGFRWSDARGSWAVIRPAVIAILQKQYLASVTAGTRYYSAARKDAGLPVLGRKLIPTPSLSAAHAGKVADSTGLGAFLHQVKGGDRWVSAWDSGRKSLMGASQNLVLSGGRDMVTALTKADPECSGWRRLTGGTCDYCDALASEGAFEKGQEFQAHDFCACTADPVFKTTASYIQNSLNSGHLKGAEEYLNADGTLDTTKAIQKLASDWQDGGPYSLSISGKALNKTQTKLLDKFFSKGGAFLDTESFPSALSSAFEDAAKAAKDAADADKSVANLFNEMQNANSKAEYEQAKEAWKTAFNKKWSEPGVDKAGEILAEKAKAKAAMEAEAEKIAAKIMGKAPEVAKEGELQIDSPHWKHAVEYIGNSISNGKIKIADEYLNADGTLNEAKAFKELLKQYNDAGGDGYDLGGLLNKTQTKMLNKFFSSGGGKAVSQGAKKALPTEDSILKKLMSDYQNGMGIGEDQKWDAYHKAFQIVQSGGNLPGSAEEAAAKAAVKLAAKSAEKAAAPLSEAETKALHDEITAWKTSSQAIRTTIQNDILKFLSGSDSGLTPGIKAIGRAIKVNSTDAPTLYRGMGWNLNDSLDAGKWSQMKGILDSGVGGIWDMPPISASAEQVWPEKFMAMKAGGSNFRTMKIIFKDTRGLNIEETGVTQGETEWITGGRFRIVSLGKHGNSFNVVVEQVSSLEKGRLKQSETKAFISAISSWKGSSSVLSKQVTEILQGKTLTVGSEYGYYSNSAANAQAIVDFIRTNTEPAPTLYRKMGWVTGDERALPFVNGNPGDILDLPAASFSSSNKLTFGHYQNVRANLTIENSQGVDISKTAGTMLSEMEWISGGEYRIVSRVKDSNGVWQIALKQLQTLAE